MAQQYSIRWRLLLSAALMLVVFMGVTGWALDRAYQHSERISLNERLETRVYALMAVADLDKRGQLSMPERLTDERFNLPGSGLVAQINADSEALWQSASLMKDIPQLPESSLGELVIVDQANSAHDWFVASFRVAWEYAANQSRQLDFVVAEDQVFYAQKVANFRWQLVLWLGIATGVLLVLLLMMLHWALKPLNRVAVDIAQIESGVSNVLEEDYPKELLPLTKNINGMIAQARQQQERYRNALADLAHSLKTPLAVMQSSIQEGDEQKLIKVADEQTRRMRETVDYHLQRASTAGRGVLRKPIKIRPQLERLAESLNKVYAGQQIQLSIDISDEQAWPIDSGDLFELAGNLMDNAMKWAGSQVKVSVNSKDNFSCLVFEDDGSGVSESDIEKVLARGGRSDETVPGQGIGLAVVQDILAAYDGKLKIKRSELGGAKFVACFGFGG